jgi:drug/metabolite transporter (DMT)-like permease
MKLVSVTALVMVAFAANSLLNRAAVGDGLIDPMGFAMIRVIAGAVTLALLARARPRLTDLGPALALSVYLVGFSFGYVALDTGIGALILFAVTQITMLTGAVVLGEHPPVRRFVGAGIAMFGLAVLMWPGSAATPDLGSVALMAAAAFGWGLYSLIGRTSTDPLRATAANFVLATPMVGLVALPLGLGAVSTPGVLLALVSGAVTSGLGYAVWYAVMPALGAARASVSMLSVPVIAILAGVVVLGESLTGAALIASGIVMAGVTLAVWPQKSPPRKVV